MAMSWYLYLPKAIPEDENEVGQSRLRPRSGLAWNFQGLVAAPLDPFNNITPGPATEPPSPIF
jgi:hypothetical protein